MFLVCKSDIVNDLPPDLFEADLEEGRAILIPSSSRPSSPAESAVHPLTLPANGVAEGLESAQLQDLIKDMLKRWS